MNKNSLTGTKPEQMSARQELQDLLNKYDNLDLRQGKEVILIR
jgi:hypothetical protein